MNRNTPPIIVLARALLAFALLLLFVFWQQIVPLNVDSKVDSKPLPMTPLPVLIVSPAIASPTVYVFATATPTAQMADALPTRIGTRTPTPTFTPMPTRTPTPEQGTRVPVQRG